VISRLLFPAITTAQNTIILFIAFSFLEEKAQYRMLLLMGIVASAFSPAAITVTQKVVHPGHRAISYSICVVFQNLLGASLAPIVIGAISDAYGIKPAMTILPIFLLLSALLFFAGFLLLRKRSEPGGKGYPGMRGLRKEAASPLGISAPRIWYGRRVSEKGFSLLPFRF
jgi:MFS family permease